MWNSTNDLRCIQRPRVDMTLDVTKAQLYNSTNFRAMNIKFWTRASSYHKSQSDWHCAAPRPPGGVHPGAASALLRGLHPHSRQVVSNVPRGINSARLVMNEVGRKWEKRRHEAQARENFSSPSPWGMYGTDIIVPATKRL